MEEYRIRTSDRGTFKRCRQMWDFTSLLRQNFEYVPGIKALDFGIAYHGALEVWYDPDMWDEDFEMRKAATLGAFLEEVNGQVKRIKDGGFWNEEVKADFKERVDLGKGMLKHYFEAQKKLNKHLRPVKTEIAFKVPIPVREHYQDILPPRFTTTPQGHLLFDGKPVYYKGRIDVIMEDTRDGSIWVMDHKTAAQFGQQEHLELDPQCGSYVWAIKVLLGIDCQGVIYSEHRKKVPKPPQRLKNGRFSKNKGQGTSYDMYVQAVLEDGQDLEYYADFLDYLSSDGMLYFRRTQVHRSPQMLEIVERNILFEAIDMLNDPMIYPNASRWNCNGCAFRTPCLAKEEQADYEWILEKSGYYLRREGEYN